MLGSKIRVRALPVAGAALCAVIVGACGVRAAAQAGTGASAATVLQQTFTGSHTIQSGVLNLSLAVTPTGSGNNGNPLELTVTGPFALSGTDRWPALDLTATASGFGQSGSLELISTGDAAYVTLGGVNYAVPAAALRQLRSALAHHEAAARARRHRSALANASRGGSDMLARLGIHPLDWLTNPTVVATNASVGGVQTTEVQAGIDVPTLVRQLFGALASRAPSSAGLPAGVPAALMGKLGAVHATVQVYTGNADRTLRELMVDVTAPLTGLPGAQGGSVTGVHVVLTLELTDLNQPQTITAPSDVQPFSALLTKLHSMLPGLGLLLHSSAGNLLAS